jgi:hypothetical protein
MVACGWPWPVSRPSNSIARMRDFAAFDGASPVFAPKVAEICYFYNPGAKGGYTGVQARLPGHPRSWTASRSTQTGASLSGGGDDCLAVDDKPTRLLVAKACTRTQHEPGHRRRAGRSGHAAPRPATARPPTTRPTTPPRWCCTNNGVSRYIGTSGPSDLGGPRVDFFS